MKYDYICDAEASRKLNKSIITLVMRRPFYSSILLKVNFEEDANLMPPTMCTNGVRVKYHPEFVRSLKPKELETVLCHEALHVVHLHHIRRESRDSNVWNNAGDYVINDILLHDGFAHISGMLYDEQFKEMSTEAVYRKIIEDQENEQSAENSSSDDGDHGDDSDESSDGSDNDDDSDAGSDTGDSDSDSDDGSDGGDDSSGNGQGDSQSDSKGMPSSDGSGLGTVCDFEGSPSQQAREEQRVAMDLQSAVQAAQATGTLPAGIERLMSDVFEPKASWVELMRRFFTQVRQNDFDFLPPNKRWIQHGIYMPAPTGVGMGPVVLAVDTSGSISDVLLSEFLAEITTIMSEVQPDKLYVVPCDARVWEDDVQELLPSDDIDLKVSGRGGTAFNPVFEWVEEQGLQPAALVYFTDMYNSDRNILEEPAYPVLWADYAHGNGFDQLFGERLIIE